MINIIIIILIRGENLDAIWEGYMDSWNVLYYLWWVFYKVCTKVKEFSPFSRVLGTNYLTSFLVD